MSVEGKFLSKEINDLFWREGLTLVTAESCTAGSVAAAITAVAGSSQFFKGGIIAYSNEIKESLLGVNHETLETHGAVSEETVIEMVKGAMKSMNSDCAVATSGIAGPTGGTPDKPVGTIWIAAGCKDKVITLKLEGDEGRKSMAQYNQTFNFISHQFIQVLLFQFLFVTAYEYKEFVVVVTVAGQKLIQHLRIVVQI